MRAHPNHTAFRVVASLCRVADEHGKDLFCYQTKKKREVANPPEACTRQQQAHASRPLRSRPLRSKGKVKLSSEKYDRIEQVALGPAFEGASDLGVCCS